MKDNPAFNSLLDVGSGIGGVLGGRRHIPEVE
jgi:hypothetical protein